MFPLVETDSFCSDVKDNEQQKKVYKWIHNNQLFSTLNEESCTAKPIMLAKHNNEVEHELANGKNSFNCENCSKCMMKVFAKAKVLVGNTAKLHVSLMNIIFQHFTDEN